MMPESLLALSHKIAREHALAAEALTEAQLAAAIRQAIAAGDFLRLVTADGDSQMVVYQPFREVERLRGLYNELLYAVESFEGESRHATALRRIREAEAPGSSAVCSIKNNPSNP